MAKKLTVTPGVDFITAGEVASGQALVSFLTQALFGDIDRDHFKTGTNPVVSSASAPSAPATGLGWHNTSTGLVSYWTGSEWLATVTKSDTAPTATGALWYDTSTGVLRVYETRGDLEGWHPTSGGYALMANRSGGTLGAGRVVVRDSTGTSNNEFTTSALAKDHSVIGVLVEETSSGANGLVALNASGVEVDVVVDSSETDGAVAKGDGLVTFSVAGEVRTVGTLPSRIRNGAVQYPTNPEYEGTPYGCFAEALSTKNSSNIVRARMLGYVGDGAHKWFDAVENDIGDFSTNVTSTDFDESANIEAKHGPVLGVYRAFEGVVGVGGGAGAQDCEFFIRRGDDGYTTNSSFSLRITGDDSGTTGSSGNLGPAYIRTSAGSGSYGQPGNVWVYKKIETSKTFTTLDSKLIGYRY